MSDDKKVDLVKLEEEVACMARLLADKEESSGKNRAINSSIIRFLGIVLEEDEVEVLKRFQTLKSRYPQVEGRPTRSPRRILPR